MLNQEQIKQINNILLTKNISYEDFRLQNLFGEFINGDHNFDFKFNNLLNSYKVNSSRSFHFNNLIKSLVSFNISENYQDINKMKEFLKIDYLILIGARSLDEISGTKIKEVINKNLNGWYSILEKENIDYEDIKIEANKIIEKISNTHIAGNISIKLKNISEKLNDISKTIKINDLFIENRSKETLISNKDIHDKYMEQCFNIMKELKNLESIYKDNDINIQKIVKESKIFEYMNEYKYLRTKIKDRVFTKSNIYYSDADEFINSKEKSKIKKIIEKYDANIQKNLISEIDIGKINNLFNSILIFKDDSFAIQDKKGIWSQKDTIDDKNDFIKDIIKKDISQKLRKNPTICKIFINKLKEDEFETIEKAYECINTYLENENILKSKDYDLLEEINELFFEDLDDSMNKYIRKHKIEKYALSITSNKYKHLYNELSYNNFELLFDEKVPERDLQLYLGKKMAAFKSQDEFNNSLTSFYKIYSGFEIEKVIERAKKLGANIVSTDDNILILKIHNFEQSSNLGSKSWCIARSDVYFKSYKENNNQYFIYDFNKEPSFINSLIGVTLKKDGCYEASHYKDDSKFSDNEIFKDLQLYIIKKDKETYRNLDKELDKEINEVEKVKRKLRW